MAGWAKVITTVGNAAKAQLAKELGADSVLNYKTDDDRAKLRRYIAARTKFYQSYYPRYYENVWKRKLAATYKVP